MQSFIFLLYMEELKIRVISVTNQKGGVGKTTTAINLAASLGYLGKRVLVVDADVQGNATSGLGVDKGSVECTLSDVLLDSKCICDAIVDTEFKNLKLVSPGKRLLELEYGVGEQNNSNEILKAALKDLKDVELDYIIVDCPPSLNLITLNALTSSTDVLVPIQCEFYALEGLSQLLSSVKQVRVRFNSSLQFLGVVFTMYSKRLRLTVQVENEVKKYLKEKVFETIIPRTVRLSEAPSFGKPIVYFDPSSIGANAYLQLAKEVLTRG